MSCEHKFMEALHERGFRFTPQREIILEVLHHTPAHSTAEEIYSQVQEVSGRVDITTLYRTLELLQELEFVNVIDMGVQGRRYELVGISSPHPHLVCRSCGSILDLDPKELQPLAARLEEEYGVRTDMAQLTLHGLCSACEAGSSSA
jgi:Fur family ferric uptake transcriptional regulator